MTSKEFVLQFLPNAWAYRTSVNTYDERYRMVTNLSKLQCLPKLYAAPVINQQPASEPDTSESREAEIDKERHHGY